MCLVISRFVRALSKEVTIREVDNNGHFKARLCLSLAPPGPSLQRYMI